VGLRLFCFYYGMIPYEVCEADLRHHLEAMIRVAAMLGPEGFELGLDLDVVLEQSAQNPARHAFHRVVALLHALLE